MQKFGGAWRDSGSLFHALVFFPEQAVKFWVMLKHPVKVFPEEFFSAIVNAAESRAVLGILDRSNCEVKIVVTDSANSDTVSCCHKPEPYIIISCAYFYESLYVCNIFMQRMSRIKHSSDSCKFVQV